MNRFKQFLLTKGISEDNFNKLDAGDQAKLHGEFIEKLADNVDGAAKAGDIETAVKTVKESMKDDFDAIKTANEALKETVEAQGVRIVEMSKGTGTAKGVELTELFKEKYDEAVEKEEYTVSRKLRFDTAKATISTDVMSVDTVNAATFPTAGSTGVVSTALRSLYGKIIGFFGPRIPQSQVMDLVDIQPIENSILIAINDTTIGTAAITPECTLKPVVKMTFATQEASANPVAVQWHTTTKLRRFFPMLAMRMEQKFAELINKQIPEVVLTAIRAGATAFTPVTQLAINDNPNNYDAIGAVIATLENLDYIPTAIMLNPIAWRNMKQEKNAEGIYTLSNGQSIALVENGLDWGGNVIRYVKDPKLGIDEFIIGDLNASVKVGVDTELMYFETDGRTDAQATTAITGLSLNIRTHVLEKFIAVIVPTGSRTGLIRDTFANVKTLITAA